MLTFRFLIVSFTNASNVAFLVVRIANEDHYYLDKKKTFGSKLMCDWRVEERAESRQFQQV